MSRDKPKAAAALAYDPEKDAAPRVVAAGRGYLAELIEKLARENNVPVYRHEELALTLTGLGAGREIPPGLYQVVAEIIAWVYRMEKKLDNNRG
ncbi:flagellar biosynthesis protein [Desulfofundulus australicus DSM 11792]|jgi:flagellar biosynthesis protein|uniref:Flagellar biosynthesis protein n=1 Tax=Desulfofundulus australicus DSM 11792 TaxID=1121425 RepID=A0A1M4ZES0_9FIRM|nr:MULTISPECIES: EscU/YscU/HrcU family type III secretion system export apparatus switch protein [Desulfofundulus]SHF16297.1 flagellar biosynthesis protein [Desulfofundulus australicus DSM 11792]